jgi:hypothetical protein
MKNTNQTREQLSLSQVLFAAFTFSFNYPQYGRSRFFETVITFYDTKRHQNAESKKILLTTINRSNFTTIAKSSDLASKSISHFVWEIRMVLHMPFILGGQAAQFCSVDSGNVHG